LAKNISIGVDIGNNQVKVVQLRKTLSGVKIDKFYIEDYALSSKELESGEVRRKAVSQILGRIFSEIKPVNVAVAISKYEENVRTILFPVMTEKQLREVLKFGGQQDYIPFDLNDMIWDINISNFYRRKDEVKTEGKEKMEVVLAVAKKSIVNNYLDIAESLNFSINILESSLLANLNFSLYNMVIPSDKIWSKVDIGAETTSVNILEGDSLKFGLNVPWGVNDIIETAEEVLALDWAAAKEFVSTMDFTQDQALADKKTKMVYSAFEGKLKDFLRQLNGAFSFFESKNEGKKVAEVYMSGGAARLLNFNKFIAEKIGKPVKVESELNKNLISYDKSQESALLNALPQLGTAIGAALRVLLPVKNNVNLLPREIIIGRNLRSRRSLLIVTVSSILLVLLVGTGYKIKLGAALQEKIEICKTDLGKEDEIVKELRIKKKAIDRLAAYTVRYTSHAKYFKKWSDMVCELAKIVPDKMWFETVEWNIGGFDASGMCKEDVVRDFADIGMKSKNFQNLKYSTRETGDGLISFRSWIKNEKQAVAAPGKAVRTGAEKVSNLPAAERRPK